MCFAHAETLPLSYLEVLSVQPDRDGLRLVGRYYVLED